MTAPRGTTERETHLRALLGADTHLQRCRAELDALQRYASLLAVAYPDTRVDASARFVEAGAQELRSALSSLMVAVAAAADEAARGAS